MIRKNKIKGQNRSVFQVLATDLAEDFIFLVWVGFLALILLLSQVMP